MEDGGGGDRGGNEGCWLSLSDDAERGTVLSALHTLRYSYNNTIDLSVLFFFF